MLITDADRRADRDGATKSITANADLVTVKAKFGVTRPGSAKGNLTLGDDAVLVPPYYNGDRRVRADGDNRNRATRSRLDGFYYDISGDYDFRLGPGRLKLIGLRHFDHEPIVDDADHRLSTAARPTTASASAAIRIIGETVGRAEYRGRPARTTGSCRSSAPTIRSTSAARCSTLSPDRQLRPGAASPAGQRQGRRRRGTKRIATLSRPLAPKLDLQVAARRRTIARSRGSTAISPPRKFFRPKGSVSLGWRPAPGWDASLKLRRRVGQISFYDFLSQPNLNQDRQNAGNPDLVPPQSWELEGEVGRELGPWGKTRLRAYDH